MNEKSLYRLQLVLILCFAGAVCFVGMRLLNAKESGSAKSVDPSPGIPKLLVEESALPGKVVKVVRNGRIEGSYTCTPQDAAVLWLSNLNKTGDAVQLYDPLLPEMPTAVDENGDTYPSSFENKGSLCLVRIFRGYAKKPADLTFQIPRADSNGRAYFPYKFKVEKLADPIRALSAPTPDQTAEGEKILIANWDPKRPTSFRITVRPEVTEKATQDAKFFRLKLVQTSYQPEGKDRYPVGTIVGRNADAVQVQVDEYQRVTSSKDLYYKDASVAVVNGVRTLRLPETEDVGVVDGVRAFVKQRITVPKSKGNGRGPVTGDLLVMLDRKPASSQPGLVPTISIDSVSPGVDEMGFDLLRARMVNYSFGRDFVSSHRKEGQMVTSIPLLKISLKVLTPTLISSKVYTIPVGHEHIDLDNLPTNRNVQEVIATNSLIPAISLAVPPKMWMFPGAGIRRAQVGFRPR